MLISETWYRKYNDYYWGASSYDIPHCDVIRFYSNGDVLLNTYVYYNGKWRKDYKGESNWELLDNDVLVYRGTHYDWGIGWEVNEHNLAIGKNNPVIYTHDNPGIDN